MKTKRKHILVLSGLKHNMDSTVKCAVHFAKLMNANVDFLYVKKPTEIVNQESQLSAIRSINREQVEMEQKMKQILDPYSNTYGIHIKGKFSFGPVKDEIKEYLDRTAPDMVILGKRKSGPFKFKDDGVTDFVLSHFEGPVLIAPKATQLEPEKELSIGILNDQKNDQKNDSILELANQSARPLKSFTIVDQYAKEELNASNNEGQYTEFIFEKKDDVLSNVSNYVVKSKVNLLCFDRNDKANTPQAQLLSTKEIINKINVPILFGGKTGFGLS